MAHAIVEGDAARPVRVVLMRRLAPYALLAPALLVFAGIFLAPLMQAMSASVGGGTLSLEHYARFISSPYLGDLWFTLLMGLGAATISTLLAIPIALVLRSPFPGRTVLYAIVLFPLVVPHIIAAYALWLSMARSGPVFSVLTAFDIIDRAPMLSRSWVGLMIALVWKHLPITALTITAAIEAIDRSMEEAARDLGAGRARRLTEVVLPLAIPGMLAGFVLVFILSASGFSIPLIVYQNTQVAPIPLGVYYQALAEDNWAYASTLGIALTASTLLLLGILTTAVRRIYHETLTG